MYIELCKCYQVFTKRHAHTILMGMYDVIIQSMKNLSNDQLRDFKDNKKEIFKKDCEKLLLRFKDKYQIIAMWNRFEESFEVKGDV